MGNTISIASALTGQAPGQARTAARPLAPIPWQVAGTVAGIVGGTIGGTWDISWHMSVGRDSFWTAPHTVIYLSVVLVATSCTSLILKATLNRKDAARQSAVMILGLWGPLGAFIAMWGCLAMLTAAPFDNWWHNAYGLDVKIVSPPHTLLSLGSFSIKIGALALLAGCMNRAEEVQRRKLARMLFLVGGIALTHVGLIATEPTWPLYMHSARCYVAAASAFPAVLVGVALASGRRWGCTATAVVYTVVLLAFEWILPLFPAQPKLGPVYQHITHLVPLRFPLLLLVPAVVLDLLLLRTGSWGRWARAAVAGPAFVLVLIAAQWPFANFLMAPASRNWVFGTAYFSYFDPAGFDYDPYRFIPLEKTPRGFWLVMLLAFLVSILTVRLGLAWGEWMRRVQR